MAKPIICTALLATGAGVAGWQVSDAAAAVAVLSAVVASVLWFGRNRWQAGGKSHAMATQMQVMVGQLEGIENAQKDHGEKLTEIRVDVAEIKRECSTRAKICPALQPRGGRRIAEDLAPGTRT